MNLHHLKYFLAIAEEGSLSAASKKLLVGQPALSAQLKQFEEWLGLKLFDRVGKRLIITNEGEYVLKYARAIKDLEDELISNVGHASEYLGKEIAIGIQESVPKAVIANTISVIRNVRRVQIKVTEGKGEELFELLMKNKLDIFIGNFRPMSGSKEILYKSLGKEGASIWGSKEFSRLKKDFPRSLEGQEFILPGFQNPVRHDFEKFMLESGINFNVSIEAQDTALQKELASRGQGLLVLGNESVEAWVKAGKLSKIGELPLKEEYWLGMARRTIDNDYIKSIFNRF